MLFGTFFYNIVYKGQIFYNPRAKKAEQDKTILLCAFLIFQAYPPDRVMRIEKPCLCKAVSYPSLYCSQRPAFIVETSQSRPGKGGLQTTLKQFSDSIKLMWFFIYGHHAHRRRTFFFRKTNGFQQINSGVFLCLLSFPAEKKVSYSPKYFCSMRVFSTRPIWVFISGAE